MSAVINAVAQLFNDLFVSLVLLEAACSAAEESLSVQLISILEGQASLGTIGNDILHVGTALMYTVVHFVSTALSKTLSFAYGAL